MEVEVDRWIDGRKWINPSNSRTYYGTTYYSASNLYMGRKEMQRERRNENKERLEYSSKRPHRPMARPDSCFWFFFPPLPCYRHVGLIKKWCEKRPRTHARSNNAPSPHTNQRHICTIPLGRQAGRESPAVRVPWGPAWVASPSGLTGR